MIKLISDLLDRLCVLIGVVVFSQIPLFVQQYTYRLEGHVRELSLQIRMMEEVAAMTGKTLNQYVQKFLSSQDVDFINQGRIIQKMIDRWQDFSIALHALQQATPLTKFFAFLRHLQPSVAKDAIDSFQPGFSLTTETIIFSVIGVLFGYLFYHSLKWLANKTKALVFTT